MPYDAPKDAYLLAFGGRLELHAIGSPTELDDLRKRRLLPRDKKNQWLTAPSLLEKTRDGRGAIMPVCIGAYSAVPYATAMAVQYELGKAQLGAPMGNKIIPSAYRIYGQIDAALSTFKDQRLQDEF